MFLRMPTLLYLGDFHSSNESGKFLDRIRRRLAAGLNSGYNFYFKFNLPISGAIHADVRTIHIFHKMNQVWVQILTQPFVDQGHRHDKLRQGIDT